MHEDHRTAHEEHRTKDKGLWAWRVEHDLRSIGIEIGIGIALRRITLQGSRALWTRERAACGAPSRASRPLSIVPLSIVPLSNAPMGIGEPSRARCSTGAFNGARALSMRGWTRSCACALALARSYRNAPCSKGEDRHGDSAVAGRRGLHRRRLHNDQARGGGGGRRSDACTAMAPGARPMSSPAAPPVSAPRAERRARRRRRRRRS